MLKRIKIISIIMVITIAFGTMTVSAQAQLTADEYLLNIGFPETVLSTMSQPQKEFIYENSVGTNATFCGYDVKSFIIDDTGSFIELNNSVSPCGGTLSSSEMTLSVFGIQSEIISTGEILYKVFPTFKWHKYVKVKNDSFAMSMYSGWEAVPGERRLVLHLLNSAGDSAQQVELAPTHASSTGYSYKIPSNIGAMQGLYEGYAYYQIDKISSTASPMISLHYAHDASSLLNASYSLSVGVGSISISGNTDNIYQMADNFYVSDLV